MSGESWETFYTVEEARALVPQLREILTAIQADKRELDEQADALRQLAPAMNGNGHATEVSRQEGRMKGLIDSIRQKVAEVTALGIEIKDLDRGLVDFPSLRDGRVVYLCWLVSEPTVSYWHDVDAGFRGRQPLDL
jgi:hypothetical protein